MQRIVNPFVYDQIRQHRMPNPTIPAWLDETYSQCYEDVFIRKTLEAYTLRNKLNSLQLSYIEIGGNHPVCTSASFLYYNQFGVNGIIVEPDPKLAENLRKFRPRDRIIEAAVVDTDDKEIEFYVSTENELSTAVPEFVEKNRLTTQKIKVQTIRVNSILEMLDVESLLLSIDVEGLDLRILKDIDFTKHRPHIITIEPSEHIVPGTSMAIIDFLREKEYRLIGKNYVNLIFEDLRRG